MRTLTTDEARAFYDDFGTKQDKQTFYEDPPVAVLLEQSRLAEAASVFEFGCGTGRLARELLLHHLPRSARYAGIDISTTMIRTAAERLAEFSPRATATLVEPGAKLPANDASVDRFVSTYVLDLLPDDAVADALAEARRVLRPGGLLCLAGLTDGTTLPSRVVMAVRQQLFAINPAWVGGCRPSRLTESLAPASWQIEFREVVVAWGIASEVVVASPRRADP